MACPACGSRKCAGVACPMATLTPSLLDEWGRDQQLSVEEQDEAIILADPENLPLILRGLECLSYIASKKRVLLEALCVMLYDAIVEQDYVTYTVEEKRERLAIAEKVKPELVKRVDLLLRPEQWISDYVKEAVFPYLGIEET